MGRNYIDISGMRFGKFVALYKTGDENNKWKCLCDCGNEFFEYSKYIRRGDRASCGKCLKEDLKGASKTAEYRAWQNMKKNHSQEVCDRWRNSFTNFLEDMGIRNEGEVLVRKDWAREYSKENCEWGKR